MSNFVINKGQLNRVCLTLSERSQLIDPYFLIQFSRKADTDGDLRYTSVQNSVAQNNRYDLLEITETTSPDGLSSEIELDTGEWSYLVYESATQTLDPTATTERVLQKGLVRVKD